MQYIEYIGYYRHMFILLPGNWANKQWYSLAMVHHGVTYSAMQAKGDVSIKVISATAALAHYCRMIFSHTRGFECTYGSE